MRSLEIALPDTVGLAFGERAGLVVRLLGPAGEPIAAGRVTFAIAADLPLESAAGSTLSAASAVTGASGEARVEVVAGAARAQFRVVAEAEDARAVAWSVGVSDAGFAALDVAPRHVGVREAGAAVEVRLYDGDMRCAELSAAEPAATRFPSRSLPGFDRTAAFDALSPAGGYAVLAWSSADGATPSATGCVDVAPRSLRAGSRVRLALPVVNRPLRTADSYSVASTFDLAPVRARVFAAGAPWSRAACPLGAAELLLDCAIDALDGSGALDCVVEAPGAVAAALEARRGPLVSGCRPATASGQPSLDALAMAALTVNVASPAASLAPAANALGDLLDSLSLESTLRLGGPTAAHALTRVTLERDGALFHRDLRSTTRPLLASSAGATRSDGDEVELALFGFTLRLGNLAASALADTGLVNANLAGLGSAIAAPLGCAGLSALVCVPSGRAATCLAAACGDALPALDAELAAPFALLDGAGLDFFVEGGGVLMDADGDLVAEQLLGGTWTATVRLGGGEEVALFGAFQARQP